MVYKTGENESTFTIKGESLNISNLKIPNTAAPETREDVEGFVIEKAYHYEKVITLLNSLYNHFIKLRIADNWTQKVVPSMAKWIKSL